MPNNRQLYTTQEAAALIGYSDARLRQLVASGKARPRKQMGGTWVFSAAEVKRLSTKRRKAGPAPLNKDFV